MKPRRARQADVAHGEHHEDRRVDRHAVDEAAEHVDLVRVHAVVDDADAEEEAGGDDAVRQHLEDGAFDALRREGEDAERHEAHVGDGRIGDELLEVRLRQRDERGVDDGDDRQREHQRRELLAGDREHRQREAQEAVAAHLQQDRRQDDGAAGRRLDVRVRQPGVHRPHRQLHRERGEEGEPQPPLHVGGELRRHQRRDVGGAGVPVHGQHGEQHQHRAEQRVEEELEGRIDAPRRRPRCR